jgi:3-hydroxypropanoate dehydrogenase
MQTTTEQLFDNARTANLYLDKPVDDALLHQLYDMLKFGPTSANCSPARIQFVKSAAAKAKLVGCMIDSNVQKTQSAPITAIIGMDMQFYDKLPELFPHTDARAWFVGNQPSIDATAFRNSSLQGGYFIIAARALGLDCGPMSGFNADKLNAAFWQGTNVKTNFVCTLGYADSSKVHARGPRLAFAQACQIV